MVPVLTLVAVYAEAGDLASELAFTGPLGSVRIDGPEPCIGNELLAFAGHGRVVSLDEKWALLVCEPATGTLISRTLLEVKDGTVPLIGVPQALATTADGASVALIWNAPMSSDDATRVGVWTPGTATPRWTALIHDDSRPGTESLVSFEDGGLVLTATTTGGAALRVFDSATGAERHQVADVALGPLGGSNRADPDNPVQIVPPVVGGALVASGGARVTCPGCDPERVPGRRVSLATGETAPTSAPEGATALPDGTTLSWTALGEDRGVLAVARGEGRVEHPLTLALRWEEYFGEQWRRASTSHWSGDRGSLAVDGRDRALLVDVRALKVREIVAPVDGAVRTLVDPSGTVGLAWTADDGLRIHAFDPATGRVSHAFPRQMARWVRGLSFSPDDRKLGVEFSDGFEVYTLPDGRPLGFRPTASMPAPDRGPPSQRPTRLLGFVDDHTVLVADESPGRAEVFRVSLTTRERTAVAAATGRDVYAEYGGPGSAVRLGETCYSVSTGKPGADCTGATSDSGPRTPRRGVAHSVLSHDGSVAAEGSRTGAVRLYRAP